MKCNRNGGDSIKKKTVIFLALVLLAVISIFTIYSVNHVSTNREFMQVVTGSSKNWEVHIYMQKAGLTDVIVVPLGERELPNKLVAIIQCSDPKKGSVQEELSLVSGHTYQVQFSTEKSLYQYSNDLQFVVLQEGGAETINLSKDKSWDVET